MKKLFELERLNGGGYILHCDGKRTAYSNKNEIEKDVREFLDKCFLRLSHPNTIIGIEIIERDGGFPKETPYP